MGLPVTLPGPAAPSDAPATPILTQAQRVTFAIKQVTPPTEVYVTQDDSLHVVLYCSKANVDVLVAFRILRADGTVIRTPQHVTPTNARARNDFFFQLTEGFLLSVDVSTATPSVLRGACWVDIDVSQGSASAAVDYQSILSDYLTTGASIGFPGARQISSVEGPGLLTFNQQFGVAATANVTLGVPSGARWRLITAQAQLQTGAAAGNRNINFIISSPTGFGLVITSQNAQLASQIVNYDFADVVPVTPAIPAQQTLQIPSNIVSDAANAFIFNVTGANAGDVWNNLQVNVEEWLEPVS